MSESYSVLCVNDLHVGHKLGVMPPSVKAFDPCANRMLKYTASKVQLRIWDEWERMCQDNKKVDYLVVNGDLCEGMNYHGRGEGCWTTEAEAQVQTCNDLLNMIKARRTLITQGSGYHTGHNPSLDQYVAAKRGAVFDNEMLLKVGALQFWFKHEVPIASKVSSRPNTLSGSFDDAKNFQAEYGKIDVVCRAHAHYFLAVRQMGMYGYVLPGWKGKDAFQQHLKTGYVPELGWARFDVDGAELADEIHTFTLKGSNLITTVSE